MTNPLVENDDPVDSGALANDGSAAEWTNGLGPIDGVVDTADAFSRGDWVEGSVNGLSAGLDMVGAVLDPIGTIGGMFFGWLIEHIGPVQDFLDEMLGDPASIKANANTWHNIAEALEKAAADLRSESVKGTSGMSGPAMTAYTGAAGIASDTITGMSVIAKGVGGAVLLGGQVLAGVREFLEKLIADACGQIVKILAEVGLSLGIATPHAVGTAVNKARELATKAKKLMDDLARSLTRFADLAGEIHPALKQGSEAMADAAHSASKTGKLELGTAGKVKSVVGSLSSMENDTKYDTNAAPA